MYIAKFQSRMIPVSLNFHKFAIFNAEISLSVFTGEQYCLLRATILHSFTFVPNYLIMMCIFCQVDILCLSASCNSLIIYDFSLSRAWVLCKHKMIR